MKQTTLRTTVAYAAATGALLCAITGAATGASAAEPAMAPATPAATRAASVTATATPTVPQVLGACESSIGEQPRTAMQGCLKAELKKARDGMRAAYGQVESELKKIDSSAKPEALRTLKHSQDSFTSFLHKECKRQGAALMGGSGAGDTELACQVALTHWRTAQLRQP